MKILDSGAVYELLDADPRVKRIRELLAAGPDVPRSEAEVYARLWEELLDHHRKLLHELYAAGEARQVDLEVHPEFRGTRLRGCTVGLSKISSRVKAEYPLRSTGGTHGTRRFALTPHARRFLAKHIEAWRAATLSSARGKRSKE